MSKCNEISGYGVKNRAPLGAQTLLIDYFGLFWNHRHPSAIILSEVLSCQDLSRSVKICQATCVWIRRGHVRKAVWAVQVQPRAVHAGDARAGEAFGTAAEVAAVQGVKLSSLAGGCWGDSMAGLKKLGHDSIFHVAYYSLIYNHYIALCSWSLWFLLGKLDINLSPQLASHLQSHIDVEPSLSVVVFTGHSLQVSVFNSSLKVFSGHLVPCRFNGGRDWRARSPKKSPLVLYKFFNT